MASKKITKKRAKRSTTSEFRAYIYIEKKLKLKDWNTSNPNTNSKGEVWTQNECLSHPEIKKCFGSARPENVIKISSDSLWIVEAKEGRTNINQAIKEAKEYADRINNISKLLAAPFATGVAGNDQDGYEIRTFFKLAGKWNTVKIGKHLLPRFMSRTEADRILSSKKSDLERPEIAVGEVVKLSNFINEELHIAKIEKEQRALIVAILLLALDQDPSLKKHSDPKIFFNDLNSRAKAIFSSAGKQDLWKAIEIKPSAETLEDLAGALDKIIYELKDADILHAAQSSDILGAFFENFLRYGNTSKDLGIVLTPRHLCWLAAEVLDIKENDIVYDPAVGTGGFLISSFNRIAKATTSAKSKDFAKKRLYGAEAAGRVAALAFINMYFRGDGKHNIKIDSCFNWKLNGASKSSQLPRFIERTKSKKTSHNLVTKVMMNPPFSLKNDKQKETDFIDHALNQLANNGLLFSVLPASVFYERKHKSWRSILLDKHTLLSVVSFPIDVFYPVATESIGVFLKKGLPHNFDSDVLWARIADDGFDKKKGFRVEKPGVHYQDVLKRLVVCMQAWVGYGNKIDSEPGNFEFSKITSEELIPQSHLGTVSNISAPLFNQEARRILRGIMTQMWDKHEETNY